MVVGSVQELLSEYVVKRGEGGESRAHDDHDYGGCGGRDCWMAEYLVEVRYRK